LGTDVNDVAAVGYHDPIPQMPMPVILNCDHMRGVDPPPGH
jgi:hypothetical protein